MVVISKFGGVGMFVFIRWLSGGYVSLFHLVLLFMGMLGVWVGLFACAIVVFASFQLLF